MTTHFFMWNYSLSQFYFSKPKHFQSWKINVHKHMLSFCVDHFFSKFLFREEFVHRENSGKILTCGNMTLFPRKILDLFSQIETQSAWDFGKVYLALVKCLNERINASTALIEERDCTKCWHGQSWHGINVGFWFSADVRQFSNVPPSMQSGTRMKGNVRTINIPKKSHPKRNRKRIKFSIIPFHSSNRNEDFQCSF